MRSAARRAAGPRSSPISPRATRGARISSHSWPPSAQPRTWSRSACRSATRWRMASPSSARAAWRSRRACRSGGCSNCWPDRNARFAAPLLLMSYMNPLLAFGLDELPRSARKAGISGFIVPDLPLEESTELGRALRQEGISLVQFVAPTTPPERAAKLCDASEGFVYALTTTGITGQDAALPDDDARLPRAPAPRFTGPGLRRIRDPQWRAGRAPRAACRRRDRGLGADRSDRSRRRRRPVPARPAGAARGLMPPLLSRGSVPRTGRGRPRGRRGKRPRNPSPGRSAWRLPSCRRES